MSFPGLTTHVTDGSGEMIMCLVERASDPQYGYPEAHGLVQEPDRPPQALAE